MSDEGKDQIIEQLSSMSEEELRRILETTRSMSAKHCGVSGSSLLRFAGAINPEDAHRMSDAIEKGCGRAARMSGGLLLDTNIVIALTVRETARL